VNLKLYAMRKEEAVAQMGQYTINCPQRPGKTTKKYQFG